MKQYIDKSVVVAELERRIKVSQDYAKCNLTEKTRIGNHAQQLELNDILGFIDTLEGIKIDTKNLEVKEVDLEKEIKLYKMRNPIIGHREESLNNYMLNVAKHFFELGLKAKKEE